MREGVIGISVTNLGDATVDIEGAEYRSNALREPAEADGTSIAAGATRTLRAVLTEPTCNERPPDDVVRVTLADGTDIELEPGDPYGQIATLTDRACALAAVQAVASLSWSPLERGEGTATLTLTLTPVGAGELQLQSVAATPLFVLVDADGTQRAEQPLDAVVSQPIGARDISFTITPGRCDAHAIAEDKQGTIFRFALLIDDEPMQVDLAVDDALRADLLTFAAETCGLA